MPGRVGLQVRPEQLAEQVGVMLQRGEVHRRLPFPQVVDQHVPHRPALDVVAVDQLLTAGLPASGEHLDRRGSVFAPAAAGVQQLVEQRAAGVHVVGLRQIRGGLEQLQAVPDPHVGDQPAFGGQDHPDPGQRLLADLQAHRGGRRTFC